MSLAEIHPVNPTPLANIEAELSVVGAVLYENEVVRRIAYLHPDHFYDEMLRAAYAACLDLIERGDNANPVSVVERMGGERVMLGPLSQAVADAFPAAAKTDADIIVNAARLRHAVGIADDVRNNARAGADAFTLIAEAERQFSRMVQDAAPASVNLIDARSSAHASLDEIDKEAVEGRAKGTMTGLRCFDRRMRGLRPGWLVVVAGRPSMGKAQPLDAKVLLADGSWTTMGALKVGDALASVDGAPSEVAGVFPQGEREILRVTLSDGRSTECCPEHLWQVSCRYWDAPRVMSAAALASLIAKARYKGRVWIDPISGDFGSAEPLPVDPWVLGALLGDGDICGVTPRFSTADPNTIHELSHRLGGDFSVTYAGQHDYRIVTAGGKTRAGVQGVVPNALVANLKALGLHGRKSHDKFIPPAYLQADRKSRVDLLRGLLDTDGWIETFGAVRFCTISKGLAGDVVTLVRSLGGKAGIGARSPSYQYLGERCSGQSAYVVNISNLGADDLFTVPQKVERMRPAVRVSRLNVASVIHSRWAEAQCIKVSHPSSLYVTDGYIVTHNTALARAAALGAAQRTQGLVVFFALEMARRELDERTLSQLSHQDGEGIAYKDMNGDTLQPGERQRLRELARDIPSNFIIDDSPILSVDYVRRRVLSLKQRAPVAAVFIDYLQIMDRPDGKGRNDASIIGEMTKGLKQLAREAQTCVVLLSQINRGVESRDDKRPQLSDLRESGAIEQDANAVLFPYREAYYLQRAEPTDPKKHADWEMQCAEVHRRMDVIAAKVRQGAVGTDHQVYFAEFDHIEDRLEDRR